MADTTRFGRGAQFGDRISRGGEGADTNACGQCEALLPDALDGTLTPQEQMLFEAHIASCGPCADMLADARRGEAWLEMLRDPRPEPSSELLQRILIRTSGLPAYVGPAAVPQPDGAGAAGGYPHMGGPLVGWRERFTAVLRGGALLQPRLAMTMAMAFFSIALTMNLTGVHLSSLNGSDLTPSGLRRSFYRADARLVQYYEGLRVVYELESRVHDLQSDPDAGNTPQTAAPAAQPAAPAPAGDAAPDKNGPASPDTGHSSPKTPGPGSSRRESLFPRARVVATSASGHAKGKRTGTLV